jgi:altronate dehydratase
MSIRPAGAEADPLILLHASDNVLVCRGEVAAGDVLMIDGEVVTAPAATPLGHKIARNDLSAGDIVIKYGAPIGSISVPVRRGEHVHLHNMRSDYIAPTSRAAFGEGRP